MKKVPYYTDEALVIWLRWVGLSFATALWAFALAALIYRNIL